jgi:predicted amidohydrolase
MVLKVAVAQIVSPYFKKEENQRKVVGMAEDAIKEGVDLVLFPEGVNLGYFVLDRSRSPKELSELALGEADTLDSPWIDELRGLAGKGIYIGCGAFLRTAEDRLVNALLLFSPAGELFTYHKTHLFHTKDSRESDYVSQGTGLGVFRPGKPGVGLSICYDLNFPEVFRTLALKGARIILISSAWPAMAGDVWDALLPARAIENEVCVIASDQTGGEYLGHSKIVDWTGRVLAGMDREEGLATAVIDLEKQEKWRRIVTYFSDRRPDLYSLKETDGSPESR